MGVPQHGWFIMGNPTKMDALPNGLVFTGLKLESLLIIMGKSMASGFDFPVKTNPLKHVILMCSSPLYYLQSNWRQNFASLEGVAVCNYGTQ